MLRKEQKPTAGKDDYRSNHHEYPHCRSMREIPDGFRAEFVGTIAEIIISNDKVNAQRRRYETVEEQRLEHPLIVIADAIVDPWTMMIHLYDAVSAFLAMMRSLWSRHVADLTNFTFRSVFDFKST